MPRWDIWFSMNFWQLDYSFISIWEWFTELWLSALYLVILARPLEYFAELKPEEQAVSYVTICSWISGWIQTPRQNNCTEHGLLNLTFIWFWGFGVLGFWGWFVWVWFSVPFSRVGSGSRVGPGFWGFDLFDCSSFSWHAISNEANFSYLASL